LREINKEKNKKKRKNHGKVLRIDIISHTDTFYVEKIIRRNR